jgi:hypothetical protein
MPIAIEKNVAHAQRCRRWVLAGLWIADVPHTPPRALPGGKGVVALRGEAGDPGDRVSSGHPPAQMQSLRHWRSALPLEKSLHSWWTSLSSASSSANLNMKLDPADALGMTAGPEVWPAIDSRGPGHAQR